MVKAKKLLKMTRELQPGIIINDRLDLGDVEGGWDIKTPEQFLPREAADDSRKTLTLDLPVVKPNVAVPVVELFVKE